MSTVQLYALGAPIILGVVGLFLGWQGIVSARRMKANARAADIMANERLAASKIEPSTPPAPASRDVQALERLAS